MDEFPETKAVPSQPRYSVQLARTFDIRLIFTDAVQMLRDGFGTFVTILILIDLPLILIQMSLVPSDMAPTTDLAAMWRFMLAALVFSFLSMFITTNVLGVVRQLSVGQAPSFGAAFVHAIARYPIVVLASLAVFIVVGVGTLFFIVPGLVAYVFGRCVVPSAVIRNRGIIDSLVNSFELVRGHWFHVFVVELIVIIGSLAVGMLVMPLYLLAGLSQGAAVLELLANLFLGAIGMFVGLIGAAMFLNLETIKYGPPAAPVPPSASTQEPPTDR